jgi:hypothetical protein
MPGSVEQVDGTFAYPWWILWPQFQDRIWTFTESHPFMVVTDIANYFDSIPLISLRNAIAELGHFKENLLNFLFYLLESFAWRPYYIPSPGVGLPQINFDAPRLLATAYLFKIDRELDRNTKGDFVRWMDDIDAGVDSRQAGKKLLRDLETVLNSQGLRLNSGKSRILSAKEAVAHFWIQENRSLTIIENSIKNGASDGLASVFVKKILRRRVRSFLRRSRSGQWEKVYKRYLKLFGLTRDAILETRASSLLEDTPSLRGAVFRYLGVLGPNTRRLAIVQGFLQSGHCEDEASLFEAIKCLISWETPAGGKLVDKIVQLAKELAAPAGVPSIGRICAALWLLAKYGSPTELFALVKDSREIWEKSPWTARQIAAVVPLMPADARSLVVSTAATNGMLQALQVLASTFSLMRVTTLDQQLRTYLAHPPPEGYPYPLQKVIVAKMVLEGGLNDGERKWLRETLLRIVSDRRYLQMLQLVSGAESRVRRANKPLKLAVGRGRPPAA